MPSNTLLLQESLWNQATHTLQEAEPPEPANLPRLLTQLKSEDIKMYPQATATVWPLLCNLNQSPSELMLKPGNSIQEVSLMIAEPLWTTELLWSEQAQAETTGMLRTHGELHGEKADSLD
jgi:hypothetical protein